MADEEAKILADARNLPLADRVEHKNWKVRSEAYDDIRAACDSAFSSSDPILDQAGPLFAKSVGDANANAMDKALEALCAWLQKADEQQAGRAVSGVCSSITAKCLKARAGTVAKATEACLLFCELEQSGTMVEAVLKALSDKVPKVVLAALDLLLRAVADFGTKVVDPKPLLKALPAVFAHSNAGVRDKVKELTVELAASLGPAVVQSTLLEKMSDAMRKDVEASIAALPPKRKQPERLTRREAAARAAASCGPEGEDSDGAVGDAGAVAMDIDDTGVDMGGDAYDFSDPVDILPQLNKAMITVGDDSTPFWDCFESKKWNMRKGALDKVKDLARTPRLACGDYGDLCRELKKVLAKDANINCAASAAEAAGALALGLRRDFNAQARQLCPAVMERFKEKNTSMGKAADETLRTMARYCYTLSEVADDIAAALGHKNPKVRLDTLRLLRDMADGIDKQQASKVKDTLVGATAKLAPDADANIREAAQAVLVAFALALGSFSAIKPFLSKLDDSRCTMVEEAVQAAAKQRDGLRNSAPSARSAPAKPAAAPAAKPAGRPPSAKASPKALAPKNANASAAGGAAAKPATRTRSSAAAPSAAAAADTDASSLGPRLTAEEAEQRLTDEFGASTVEELRSAQWQERLGAISAIADNARASAPEPDTAALIMCLAHIPGWSDKNFQVLNKIFEVASVLAKECPGVGKREAAVAIEGAADKVHELKHRLQACEVLTAMSECVGPRFVASQLHTRAAANKNPKVLSESLAWLAQAVEDFGLAAMDLPALLQWMIADLGSPNAPVRNQAMAVLGKCHAQVGGGLMAQLADALKPAQVTALEEIFRKHPQDAEYQPSRKVKARKGRAPGGAGAASGALGAQVDEDDHSAPQNLEDLLPRADISGALTPSLIGRISNANWKERNAAMEEIEGILREAGGRIQPDLPSDLFPSLRGRLTDTNRNLAAKALLLIAKFADAVGAPFDRLARPVLVPALGTLSDNKKQVRDAVIVMLDSWLATCPAEKLFPAVADAACNAKCNVDGRIAALAWMQRAVEEGKAAKCTDAGLRGAAVAIADKAAAVRDAGGQLLAALVQSVGGNEVNRALAGLDSGVRKAAEPMVIKAVAAAGPTGAEPKAASASALAPQPAGSKSVGRSRTTSASATASSASAPMRPLALATDDGPAPILGMGTGKATRARQFRVRPGNYEGPSADELDQLEAGLAPVASGDFMALLFSREFKDHVKAADALVAALPTLLPEITASLDLLLRWAVVRVCEGNTQALVRVLEALRALLDELSASGYRMLDVEAAALLPAVVEKSGHNQDRVRGLHRDVLRAACAVYPSPRVLEYITQGLGSKNSRTRVECCEEIAALVDREGSAPVIACKAKPMVAVAALLKERDGVLRGASLAVIEGVWAEQGPDTLWKLLGPLESREKGMVEDRLRRSTKATKFGDAAAAEVAGPAYTPEAPRPGAFDPYAGVSQGNGAGQASLQPTDNGGNGELSYARPALTPPNALDITPVAERTRPATYGEENAASTPDAYIPRAVAPSAIATPVPQPMPSTPAARVIPQTGPEDAAFERRWEEHLAAMAGPSLPDAINATKMLCADVMLVADPKAPPASQRVRAVMAASAERLFGTVLAQLDCIFDQAEQEAALGVPASSRGCKFALNVLLQGLGVPEVALGLPQATLRETMSVLLCRLVDERGLTVFDEGPTLVRAVNVLIAKLLENADRNCAFAALLQLLREPPAGVTGDLLAKYNVVVVKCLIKLTKALGGGVAGVDLSRLLFNIHDFFMYLGVDEIRKRSRSDDKPLRMVKTILFEVCKVTGHRVYDYAAGIPGRHSDHPPIIFTYIQLNLNQLQQEGKLGAAIDPGPEVPSPAPVVAPGQERPARAVPWAEEVPPAAPAEIQAQAAKAEVKLRLKEVMMRLVSKDAAQQEAAMVDLARLKKEQPKYVERYIAGTADKFRQFIDDGLARLEAQGTPILTPRPSTGVSPMPRLDLGGQAGPGGGYGDAPSPGSARAETPQSQGRLSSLRERLSHIKASTEGAPAGMSGVSSSENLAAYGGAGPVPQTQPSVDELAARLQMLRRGNQ